MQKTTGRASAAETTWFRLALGMATMMLLPIIGASAWGQSSPGPPTFHPGDLILTARSGGQGAGLVSVNRLTGSQSLIAWGGLIDQPYGIALTDSGTALVVDLTSNSVVAINMATGIATTRATNVAQRTAFDIALTGNGFIVSDAQGSPLLNIYGQLKSFDLAGNVRPIFTPISNSTCPGILDNTLRGGRLGPCFLTTGLVEPRHLAYVPATQTLLVADSRAALGGDPSAYEVSPQQENAGFNPGVGSSSAHGNAPQIPSAPRPIGLARAPGSSVTYSTEGSTVFRDYSVLTTGGSLVAARGVEIDASNQIVVANGLSENFVVVVGPSGGAQTVFSNLVAPSPIDVRDVAIVPSSFDQDADGTPNDGDQSGFSGDQPCTAGSLLLCDDNCPTTPNPSQLDFDLDHAGNACDGDDDDDGLEDMAETDTGIFVSSSDTGSDPLNWDTDADGLNDGDEVDIQGTDPNKPDTDGDGLNDGDEVNTHATDPLQADTDGDGLDDGNEVNLYGTNPLLADTDGDFLSDGGEVNTHGTNPLEDDSDSDGFLDSAEVNLGSDPLAGTATPTVAPFLVNDSVDTADAQPGDGLCASVAGNCTLRAAVIETNALPGANEIQLPGGDYQLLIAGINEDASATGDLDVTDDLLVEGLGNRSDVRILGEGSGQADPASVAAAVDRVLDIIGGSSFTLRHATVANGVGADGTSGGGIRSVGTLEIDDVELLNNSSNRVGGAVDSTGSLTLRDSLVQNNDAYYGSAGVSSGPTTLVERTTFDLNGHGDLQDGGALSAGGQVTIRDSVVTGNIADDGGAMILGGDVLIERTSFDGNCADVGGGIVFADGDLQVRDSRFTRNCDAALLVGLFGTGQSSVEVRGTAFEDNSGSQFPAILVYAGFLSLSRSTLRGNSPSGISNFGSAEIIDSSIVANRARDGFIGGGVVNSGSMLILNSTISGNVAESDTGLGGRAGGVYNNGQLRILFSTITENTAQGASTQSRAGGIENQGTLELGGSILARNWADVGPDCIGQPGSIESSNGNNLVGIGDDCPGVAGPADIVGTSGAPIDPILGPLADNGGLGWTHAVLSGSPAQGAIPDSQCIYDDDDDPQTPDVFLLTDQRGVARPSFGLCEIGAYEKLAHCKDLIDNDGDGLIDLADPGCSSQFDQSEDAGELVCDDGIDNDGDGLVDFRVDGFGDPVCTSVTGTTEVAQCQDGVDNDGQFGTDFDGGESIFGSGNGDPNGPDPQCTAFWDDLEAAVHIGCGLGPELAVLLPLLGFWRHRRHRHNVA